MGGRTAKFRYRTSESAVTRSSVDKSIIYVVEYHVLTGCSWQLEVLLCLVGVPGPVRVIISSGGRLFAILGAFLRHKLLIHT